MKVVCETERLIIRHFNLGDVDFIIELLNEDSFIRYIADKNVRTKVDAENYLHNGPFYSYKTFGFGLNLVELKSTGAPIGMCGLLKRKELEYPDIGYAFLPSFCGKGYAYEAMCSILKDGVLMHSLQKVLAVTLPDNVSSSTLLRRAGFTFLGEMELYNSQNNVYEYQVEKGGQVI